MAAHRGQVWREEEQVSGTPADTAPTSKLKLKVCRARLSIPSSGQYRRGNWMHTCAQLRQRTCWATEPCWVIHNVRRVSRDPDGQWLIQEVLDPAESGSHGGCNRRTGRNYPQRARRLSSCSRWTYRMRRNCPPYWHIDTDSSVYGSHQW